MNQFRQILQNINDKLDLPQPVKSRILLEISGDLDDLFHHYLEQGLEIQDARQQAIETLNLDGTALNELVQIHTSPFKRFWTQLSEQAQSKWERTIILTTLCVLILLAGQSMTHIDFFSQASRFVWGVAGVGVLIFTNFLYHIYRLCIKRDHSIRTLRNGLNVLPVLAGVSLFVAVAGLFLEASWLENKFVIHGPYLIIMMNKHLVNTSDLLMQLTTWMLKTSALLMFAMVISIFGAFAWYIVINKIQRIEQAEAAMLLQP